MQAQTQIKSLSSVEKSMQRYKKLINKLETELEVCKFERDAVAKGFKKLAKVVAKMKNAEEMHKKLLEESQQFETNYKASVNKNEVERIIKENKYMDNLINEAFGKATYLNELDLC